MGKNNIMFIAGERLEAGDVVVLAADLKLYKAKAEEPMTSSTEEPSFKELDPFLFIKPAKTLDVAGNDFKCYECGNTENLEKYKSDSWTKTYICYKCGHLNYVICSDRMGGVFTDTVNLFKMHPKKDI